VTTCLITENRSLRSYILQGPSTCRAREQYTSSTPLS